MYKSSNFRKAQPQQDSTSTRHGPQVKQLKEAFPAWTELDLESLLVEVNGDIELASMRIIEGHAEQWGNVTRKKDKKSSAPTSSYNKDSAAGGGRGDFRGGRGGRGARGGAVRGGARGGVSARGGHHDVNGHRAKPSQSAEAVKDATAVDAPVTNGEAADVDGDATSAWNSSTPTTWGGDTTAVNGATSHPTPAPAPVASAHTPAQVPAPGPSANKAGVTPATSKLSWAQIARKPQEKPAPPPAPVAAPPPTAPSAPSPPAPQAQHHEPAPPVETPEAPTTSTGWEEPTTVQEPIWDDEPRAAQAVEPAPVLEEAKPAQPEPTVVEEPAPVASPAVPQQLSPEIPAALPPKPQTPSIQARATPVSHRAPKFKTTDQPVVMPASFGSGLERIGMQFGSLSLGGEDIDSHEPTPVEQKPAPPAAPEHVAAPAPPPQEPAAPIASPPAQTPLTSGSLFQNSLPQQQQQQPQQLQQPAQPPHLAALPQQSTLTSSLTQPSLPSSTSTSAISPYSQQSQAISQQSLASHQSQQPPAQSHHAYAQHGLGAHLEQQQQQQQHVAPQPQQPQATQAQNLGGGPSSYFRQPEAPYFHAPTPPAGQSQDSPYGSFGQLNQQVQHQAQGSHLGNFGGADYGYGDSQRNFYDSYSGPTGFANRSVLGHDDLKGLPGSQQPHAAPGLPPAGAQSSQQHPPSSQAGSQGQPTAGQGPQQGYPPPLPYYYPYPQNQYYGSPYSSGYTVPQPFVKYPTVFQGPPGPQSAPSPAAKQGPSAVQPQSPYGQGLYGQQQQHQPNTYDDLGYQHHAQHSVGQNVNVGSGLPSSEYGKHQSLYGSGSQGIQGFMGLGQSTGPSTGPPLGQRATGGSPEAAYKPYGGNVGGVKDVGAGVGVGVGQAGVGVGQGPQGRGGVQQPGQGSFYAQRFAASQAGGPQGAQGQQPQGQGPQGHLGYPQGGSDGSTFYSYQPRQQQGYWQ
ncbi:uncharacterized protein TRAVEDRAFT_38481 [Trametes versicolor FP-101664 SS1]|uniref:uncharacterized protein n=1 Tax=Trametes versicolor (strain FP-101664) TaxID=717944 RepID=UPI00046228B1|nr:uncharacterized protein TRAVEDRAFT_38481 [Trametes versicolor FP-101664 SS1]EIW56556.1 hypothetical protein TRAVEDRAFT_38481 [Trametes versicolor FP-101664 SS1]